MQSKQRTIDIGARGEKRQKGLKCLNTQISNVQECWLPILQFLHSSQGTQHHADKPAGGQ